ncbi:MAG TPA: T9SS type A sorting domain-containing protein, partial [Bacteroidales bacterium]|nr:T9SS type A sorting domain-containing protein [Bacteroidales bacterium]
DVQGLITGSVLLEEKRLIALCGYSSFLEPFILILYDFTGTSFFGGNKRKIPVSLPFHQVEAITTINGLKYYITNESFVQSPFINSPQKLHIIELNVFLENYLGRPAGIIEPDKSGEYPVFPVPASDFLTIKSSAGQLPSRYNILNSEGKVVQTGRLDVDNPVIDISGLTSGLFILKLGRGSSSTYKFIKIKG